MSYRLTLALLAVLAVAIGSVYLLGGEDAPAPRVQDPFFYDVLAESINAVEITHHSTKQAFLWSPDREAWVFDEPSQPLVYSERWGGVPLLLSGPTVNRILTESAEDVGRYLLDEPPTTIRVGLDDGESIVIWLGADTPDRRNYYAMREGSSQLVLIDHLWGDVLIKLATDPPYEP
jgi:hypothetical protein